MASTPTTSSSAQGPRAVPDGEPTRSIGPRSDVIEGPAGEIAHRELIEHSTLLAPRRFRVGDGVHVVMGNGLSNQVFIEGPGGLVAIDTGESVQEMEAALTMVAEVTEAPVVAVVYSHFHYVGGTRAIPGADAVDFPIWSHADVPRNLARQSGEVGPVSRLGLVKQFGIMLPDSGPDSPPNVGLGLRFRLDAHAPHTHGHLPPNHVFTDETEVELAGLHFRFTPCPSDADDSITIWCEELGVAINNIVWPALFNVFPIRGEEYRDPRVLLAGLDHLLSLGAEHLVGVHGPPISGVDEVRASITDTRDSIAFLWDQTVRGINKGLTNGELARFVQLPDRFRQRHVTRQFYGLAEHHTQQIHAGLRGWFDGDPGQLFKLDPSDEGTRVIEAMGGPDAVAGTITQALDDDDLRWALRLASWLHRAGSADGTALLARALRAVGQQTTSSNVRNWCLTTALDLEGVISLSRLRRPVTGRGAVLANDPAVFVHGLRVLIVPERAAGMHLALRWAFSDGPTIGLRLRDGVAVALDQEAAAVPGATDVTLRLDHATWADLYSGNTTPADAVATGRLVLDDSGGGVVPGRGDLDALDRVTAFFAVFDHPHLGSLDN